MSNLQLFTEPGGDGGGSGEGDGAGTGGDPGSNSNTTMSFDDFLKLEGNQSEFDRRVQKAVNTAVTNAQTKWKTGHHITLVECDQNYKAVRSGDVAVTVNPGA